MRRDSEKLRAHEREVVTDRERLKRASAKQLERERKRQFARTQGREVERLKAQVEAQTCERHAQADQLKREQDE